MDRKEKAHVRDISKKIKKKKRKVKQQKIQQTREGTDYSGRGIRSIANIKTRKILITRMRNEFGDIEQRGKVLLTHFRFFVKICTHVKTMKEKMRRTMKIDLKTLVTMLTMMMNKY